MKRMKVAIIVALLIGTVLGYLFVKPYYNLLTEDLKIDPIQTLLSTNGIKTINDTVNILVLGIPGGKHDGPNLSDSMIVLHYDFKTNKLTTIGIPRDIWSDTMKDKINTAYAYGEAKQEDGGLKLAKAEVGAIVGMPIQYAMVISFNRFKDLVDYLGGIEIDVEKSFTDPEFPIEGKENDLCGGDPKYKCRYETVTFKKGLTHMNGETALKFVRSRHAEGSEGSDFARSRRQQVVISALKEKIIAIATERDIEKIKGFYQKADSLVNRDITNQELAAVAKDILFSKNFVQKSTFLPEELFYVPDYTEYSGKYVLVPEGDSFSPIHTYVNCILASWDEKKCSVSIDKGEEDQGKGEEEN
jgi:LCP family protein required for cell wall assembly